jgi:hypothetical protein
MPGFEVARILPTIIRAFPELVRGSPTVGRILPLMNVEPTSDELLDRSLDRKFKRKTKKGFNDEIYVIKLDDAISCVEKVFSAPDLKRKGLLALAREAINQTTGESPLGTKIVDCLREHVLSQKSIRSKNRHGTSWGRPAVGHGKGRTGGGRGVFVG